MGDVIILSGKENTAPAPNPAQRKRPTMLFRNFILRMLAVPSVSAIIGSPMRSNAYRGGRHLNQRQRRKQFRQSRSMAAIGR